MINFGKGIKVNVKRKKEERERKDVTATDKHTVELFFVVPGLALWFLHQ